jgi:hypothetical protein
MSGAGGLLRAADVKAISPPGDQIVGSYTPGLVAGQVRQTLDNVKLIVEAAGLSMEHVVFVNPYLTESLRIGKMDRAYAKYFKFGDTFYCSAKSAFIPGPTAGGITLPAWRTRCGNQCAIFLTGWKRSG